MRRAPMGVSSPFHPALLHLALHLRGAFPTCVPPLWAEHGAAGAIQAQLLHRNEKRFRGGLVFKAHRWLYHSTLGSEEEKVQQGAWPLHSEALTGAAPFRVQGSGFRVQGSGFRVQGSGFRVQGSGFRVQGSGFRVQGSGFRVQGSGSRVQG